MLPVGITALAASAGEGEKSTDEDSEETLTEEQIKDIEDFKKKFKDMGPEVVESVVKKKKKIMNLKIKS